jgi:hypothetical protein
MAPFLEPLQAAPGSQNVFGALSQPPSTFRLGNAQTMRMDLSLEVDSLGIIFGSLNSCFGSVLFTLASHRALDSSNIFCGFVSSQHPRVVELLPFLVVVFLLALDSPRE